jgi:hypothetical protein
MFYNEKFIHYRCELRFEDSDFLVIKNLLIRILGKPKSSILHQFIVVNMENGEEAGEGFQLALTTEKLAELQNQCKVHIVYGKWPYLVMITWIKYNGLCNKR